MKSKYEKKVRKLLKDWSIPWVLGWIHSLWDDYEIDDVEETYLYSIADPEERFNCPAEYDWCRDPDEDFTPEEIAEWDELEDEKERQ